MNFMSRTLTAAVVTIAFSLPAFAQYPPASSAASSGLPNQTAWDKMLSKHPKAAAQLSANPNLIYQPAWQASHPEFRTFLENHPADWRALKANGSQYYDGKFNSFLGHHPNLAAQLQADPSLVNNPAFRRNHPALNQYLASHPNVWGTLRRQNMATTAAAAVSGTGGGGQGFGAYDQTGAWRDANWWHGHHVDWARQHHPEWWHANGPYYGHPEDGDWDDEHHEWHDRWWWHHHHPDWVHRHHPDWWYAHKEAIAENHRAHEEWKHQNWEEKHHREWQGHHGHGR